MSGQFIDEGEVTRTEQDSEGEVVGRLKLPGQDEPTEDEIRVRFPAGIQARLIDGREADALILRDGRLIEALTMVDREATSQLPELQKGQTRIHSLDENPQLISILTSAILLGRNAQKGVVRDGDTIDSGTIVLVFSNVLAGPSFTLTITYTDGIGTVPPLIIGPITFAGTGLGAPGTFTIRLKGKAIQFSNLVKAQ